VISVLIVDDHALVRAGLVARLAGEADIAPIGEAGTVAEALSLAKRLQPDLVLLDLMLPKTSASDTIAPLRSVAADSGILMIVDSRWDHLAWMHQHFTDNVLGMSDLGLNEDGSEPEE
jgi:DNA-binding NarL/FixJ family response regulator